MQRKPVELTQRQWEVLAFINSHRRREQRNPTCQDIGLYFGWASDNAAYEHLRALQTKGVIVKRDSGNYVVLSPWIRPRWGDVVRQIAYAAVKNEQKGSNP